MVDYERLYRSAADFLHHEEAGGLGFHTVMTSNEAIDAATKLRERSIIAMPVMVGMILPRGRVAHYTIVVARTEEALEALLEKLREDGAADPPEVIITTLVH